MIVLTRLNGPPLAVNCDLIERVEATPDTIVTLVEGTKYVVQESVEQVIERVREFRASVVVMAQRLEQEVAAEPSLRLVSQPVNMTSVTRRNKLQRAEPPMPTKPTHAANPQADSSPGPHEGGES